MHMPVESPTPRTCNNLCKSHIKEAYIEGLQQYMYIIELHSLGINKHTFILFSLFLFLCLFSLQRDLKQSLNVLALLFINRYLEWARSLFTFCCYLKSFICFPNYSRSIA